MEAAVPAETHMERQSLDRDAVLQLVKEQLADIMESDVDAIGEDDRFAEEMCIRDRAWRARSARRRSGR